MVDLLRTHVWGQGHQTPPGAGAAGLAEHGEHRCSFPIGCVKKVSLLHTRHRNFSLRTTTPGLALLCSYHDRNPTASPYLLTPDLCCGGWAVPSLPRAWFVFTERLSLAGQYLNAQL